MIRVILVDDEKSMLLIMKKMISKIPDIELVGTFQSAGEAYKFIEVNMAEIAFVDINMPGESGLDFARRLAADAINTAVVFITAHKEYALDAFDVNAYDYIVKPISQVRLEMSIQRTIKRNSFLQAVKEGGNSARLLVYCLGGMEVRSAAGSAVQFSSSKSSELMAYLLMKKGKFVSKWSIIEDVFRGMPPQNAETYLNTTIYKLRKALDSHGMKSRIISANESYKFDIRNIYVDFIDFENQINEFSDISSVNQSAALKAEKIYEGELFGEKDYYWSLLEKERLSEVYWSFSKRLAGYLVECHQLTVALQILKKLVHINELDEEVNCLLMRVYAAQRDRISMERQYERYAKVLRKELGIAPEIMARNLYVSLKKSCDNFTY